MKSVALLPLLLCLPACGTITDWREMQTAPMTFGECWEGFVYIATHDSFLPDTSACDRGLGLWQSRWRERQGDRFRPIRYRLRAEVLLDEGSTATGWPIRFAVEQQTVEDLRHSREPREEDWSGAGQDREREAILGDKLVRRLAPKRP